MSGRTALITGATGRLGQHMAETIAELGGGVILVDKPKSDYTSLINKLRKYGVEVFCMDCDLENEGDRKHLIAKINEKYLSIENKDSHSLKIYTNLINTFNFNEKVIIKGKIKMNRLIIFDGLHRSCILLKNNFKTIKILRVEKFPLIDKTKHYMLNKIIN